jgi:hypothetical protein
MSFDRDYRQSATLSIRGQLSRAIILIRQVDRMGSVTGARAVTGFDAARIKGGAVEAATRDETDLIEALGTPGPPPPNFTSSGVLALEDGNRFYSAARTPDGATMILIGPDSDKQLGGGPQADGAGWYPDPAAPVDVPLVGRFPPSGHSQSKVHREVRARSPLIHQT